MARRPDHRGTIDAKPALYLVTPQVEDAAAFSAALAPVLAAVEIAAVLVRLVEADERSMIERIKILAPVIQNTGAALVVDRQPGIVARAGADGAQSYGVAEFKAALPYLKPERIAGAGGLRSRHDAMLVAEAGADYVMFGEFGPDGRRPPFEAVVERVAWWAGLFEVPCVAYAASFQEVAPLCAAGPEFLALGDWIFADRLGAPAVIAGISADLAAKATA